MPDRKKKISLAIESLPENVSLVGMAVRGICEQVITDADCVCHMELSVVEAVNNSIFHGYDGQPGHVVEIAIELGTEKITFFISDMGKGFPNGMLKSEQPEFDPDDLDSLACSGMGISLMKQAMDKVSIECHKKKHTIIMEKKL